MLLSKCAMCNCKKLRLIKKPDASWVLSKLESKIL